MSKIIDKAFDVGKKIVRSIFRGSPNLITSADLNRQVEALKYQIDSLDNRVGGLSDVVITPLFSGSTLRISVDYSYMEFKGCSFLPSKTIDSSINLTASAPTVYVCLSATTRIVTYSDDSSHEIAGAKFQDGSSYPAADQIIYEGEKIILSHSITDVQDIVGVIAVISLVNGKAVVNKNVVEKGKSLPLSFNTSSSVVDFYKVVSIDYSGNIFSLPEYFKFSVGDIIKLHIPYAIISLGSEGISSFELEIPITSLTENNFSGFIPIIGGEIADAKVYSAQGIFVPKTKIITLSSLLKFSKIEGVYVEVIKGSMLS